MIVAREDVLAAYADGVEAVERAAGDITDWAAPTPCVEWRAVDLAGHLLAIARYYHRLLDVDVLDPQHLPAVDSPDPAA